MEDLTTHGPKLKKNQKPITVYNPNPYPVTANDAGQMLGGFRQGLVHPDDEIAKRTVEAGVLQVISL